MRIPRITVKEAVLRQMWCLIYLAKAVELATDNPKVVAVLTDALTNGIPESKEK